jgi:hypothetical protein
MSTITILRRSLGGLAVALSFLVSGAAQAGFYGGKFDPPVFDGFAWFQIGDDCLTHNGVNVANLNLAPFYSCTNVAMQGTGSGFPLPVINLTNLANPAGHTTTTLNFTGFATDSVDMQLVYVLDHQFAGLETGFIGGFFDNDPTYFGSKQWWVQFVATPTFNSDHQLTSVTNAVKLFYDCPMVSIGRSERKVADCDDIAPIDVATDVKFAPLAALVPEPGSLSLILGGLGIGWLARRRKAS